GVNTAASSTSLTVKITNSPVLSTALGKNLKFEVRDQANQILFSFNGNVKAGAQIYLGDDIGLYISFSAGTLTQNHTASPTVSHTPTNVDVWLTVDRKSTRLNSSHT